MNIPNVLTLFRILLVPFIVILIIRKAFFYVLIAFICAGITDALDGFLARILKQQTALGAYLDPVADKALMASTFISLSIFHFIPGWLAVIVISRDFIILLGILILFIMSVSVEMKATIISKLTMVCQTLTVFFVLLFNSFPDYRNRDLLDSMFWLTALFTVMSGLHYIHRGIQYVNTVSNSDS